jgi:hypothetical protein
MLFLSYSEIVHKCTNNEDRSCALELTLEGKIVHDEEVLPGLKTCTGAIARLYRGEN